MIRTKKELEFYMAADSMMNKGYFKPDVLTALKQIICPNIISFLTALRHVEYYTFQFNMNGGGINRVLLAFWRFVHLKLSVRFGFSIYPDTIGYGLFIPHYGTIIVGANNRIGNYALLNACTCITQAETIIGDGLFMGNGAVISGHHILSDNVTIGANSVVTKDFNEGNITICGMPAKVIKTETTAWYQSLWPEWNDRIKLIEELRKELLVGLK